MSLNTSLKKEGRRQRAGGRREEDLTCFFHSLGLARRRSGTLKNLQPVLGAEFLDI
ncbi:MAG: hypothetical protein F6K14_01530 [Symploca sp. SIO2C1]|nr:hypothetical protein [Symploca sp. SIO2C1]